MKIKLVTAAALGAFGFFATTAVADSLFFFSTGDPDGKMGTASRQASPGRLETETADDFVLTQPTNISQATITGLIPAGTPPLYGIKNVEVEVYRVFPADSASPPSGNVPTRINSPADVEIGSATRDGANASLSFSATLLNPSFTVANTVVDSIHKSPNQFTGGEGAATGQEALLIVNFTTPINLAPGHYFFRPEVQLTDGSFLWLSAPKPIVGGGTPLATPFPAGSADLQTWIRNTDLKPDWLRVGSDITQQGPFNASFSLIGTVVPEESSFIMLLAGLIAVGAWAQRKRF